MVFFFGEGKFEVIVYIGESLIVWDLYWGYMFYF